MRIAAFQMYSELKNIDANLAKIGKAAQAAAAMGAQLLVTPEMSVTGYGLGDATAHIAEANDGVIVGRLKALSELHGITIVAGFAERDGYDVYNSVVLAEPDGRTEFYRKSHLYGDMERSAFKPSDQGPKVFDLGPFKAAMLICYDVEFPEIVRAAALAGAELLIVPTAVPCSPSNRRVPEQVVPSRAMENQLFIIYADLCGNDGVLTYEGHSVICSPDGGFLARGGSGECLLVTDLDPTLYAAAKAVNPYFQDRRPELYGSVADARKAG